MKKRDFLLLGVLLLLIPVFFWMFRLNRPQGASVTVRVGAELQGVYSLLEERTVVIEGRHGGRNTLVIENGKAFLSEATCPDNLCVLQGEVGKQGESIICLPNEVIIEVHSDSEDEEEGLDAIVR